MTDEIILEKKGTLTRTLKKIISNRRAKTKQKTKQEPFFMGSQISNKSSKLKNKEKKGKIEGLDDRKFAILFKNYLNMSENFENILDGSLLDNSTNISPRNTNLSKESKRFFPSTILMQENKNPGSRLSRAK